MSSNRRGPPDGAAARAPTAPAASTSTSPPDGGWAATRPGDRAQREEGGLRTHRAGGARRRASAWRVKLPAPRGRTSPCLHAVRPQRADRTPVPPRLARGV